MKTLSIIFALSTSTLFTFGQTLPIDSARQQVDWTEVVQAGEVSANELYNRGRMYFVNNYKSAKDVLQLEDRESGRLVGRAFTDIGWSLGITYFRTRMYYTISISCREGRYKYQITDIEYSSYAEAQLPSTKSWPNQWYIPEALMVKPNGKPKKIAVNYYNHTYEAIKRTANALKASMEITAPAEEKEDDW